MRQRGNGLRRHIYETILNYIATTTTKAGLRVHAHLSKTVYATGLRITDEELAAVDIRRLALQPKRNYTIIPGSEAAAYNFTNPTHNENSYRPAATENLELIFA